MWRNGIKVPIVDEFWLGGCNYAKGIVFYNGGPHVRCFYYEGTRRVDQCLKVYVSEVDDIYWCYYDDGSKELFRNHKHGLEMTDDHTAEIHMERTEWVQPRTIYRATKLLRNPEACLHESISENICREEEEICPTCGQPINDKNSVVVSDVYNLKANRSCNCTRRIQ